MAKQQVARKVSLQGVRAVLEKAGIVVSSRDSWTHHNCATLAKEGYRDLEGVGVTYYQDFGHTGTARMGGKTYPTSTHAQAEIARILREAGFQDVCFLEYGTAQEFGHRYELHVVGNPEGLRYRSARRVDDQVAIQAACSGVIEVLRSKIAEQQRKRAEACKPFDAEIARLEQLIREVWTPEDKE